MKHPQDPGTREMPLPGHAIGYARVSTADQDVSLQLDALKAAGCHRIFEDVAGGAKADRPGLAEAMSYLRAGDTFTVWKLDRLGRSLSHLVQTMVAIHEAGAQFRSLSEGIDTSTPGGRLLFNLFGTLAEFERELIHERTNAGLASARARGRKGGRRAVVTADKLAKARQLIDKDTGPGLTVREAAGRLKVGKTALYNALQAADQAAAEAKTT